jgi:hypothetical protein
MKNKIVTNKELIENRFINGDFMCLYEYTFSDGEKVKEWVQENDYIRNLEFNGDT